MGVSIFLAPLRRENGPALPPFSNSSQYKNFLDFYSQRTIHRPLFNPSQTLSNLDEDSIAFLERILPENLPDQFKEVIGEIVPRLFALGCLDRDRCTPQEFEGAKAQLNLEIVQLVQKFLAMKKRAVGQEQ